MVNQLGLQKPTEVGSAVLVNNALHRVCLSFAQHTRVALCTMV